MGVIVAALHKEEQTATKAVFTMLKELSRCGMDTYVIASAKEQSLSNSIEELNLEKIRSNTVLGYGFSKLSPKNTPRLITSSTYTLVFEGKTYPSSKISEKPDPKETAEAIIRNCDGTYAFAIVSSNSLILGRDAMGIAPLYFGRNKILFAVASERKALWKLGLKAESFPPGNIAITKKDNGFSFKPIKKITQPPPKPLTMDFAAKSLQRLMVQSTKDRVSDVKEVAVAFSGGLDSSIVAFLARKCGVKAQLITVGLENMPETGYAEDAAKALDMPIHVKTYTIDDVEKVLPKVLWLIEEPNIVNTSIAIPLYWAAELASVHGLNILLAGQGADELFGGYYRYLSMYAEKSADTLQKILLNDVARCYATNFQRDNPVCMFHNVELRLPFTDLRVVNFALSLPLRLKIESPNDKLRKRVLRKVAENFALPPFIVNKPKKAIQYATGVNKALQKLAKRENLNPSHYVRKVFRKIFPDVRLDD
jgi:asparagine synthase (glutamine-hydrolysing)